MQISNRKAVAIAATAAFAIGVPTAGAAAKHFITGKDVKNGSLTSADVKNLSLHAQDFDKKVQAALKARSENSLARGATGATGAMGATGATGAAGETGARGPQGNQGIQGKDGLSAFVIWSQSHPGANEAAFLAALKGEQGETGAAGVQN
ncbi:MAG TPA: hypothetical protein VKB54_05385, partial [Solirubrobacteraceae bacterium]|nr:hypothetical protein [Solirubrobacteraceae bacterium]